MKTQVHLILDCNSESAATIAAYADRVGRSVRIVCNDRGLFQRFYSTGHEAGLLEDLAPIDSPPDLAAYAKTHEFLDAARQVLESRSYRRALIYGAIEQWLYNALIFVEKATHVIHELDGACDHVIFALSAYDHCYLALLDVAHTEGRIEPGDLCLSVRHGRLSPWADYAERRLEDRMDLGAREGGLSLARLLDARRHAVEPGGRTCAAQASILFFLRTNEYGLYLKPVIPLLERLRRAGTRFEVLTSDPLVVTQLEPVGVQPLLLDGRSDDSLDAIHLRLFHDEALRYLQREILIAADRLEPRFPIGAAVLRHCDGDAFQRLALEHLRLVDTLIDAIRCFRPRSLMVVPDTIPSSRIVSSVAARFGVTTVTTLAASVSPVLRHIGTYSVDLIAVAGQDDLEALLAAGYERSRIVVTGSPMFDRIAQASPEQDRAHVLEKLPLDPDRRILLIAASRVDPNEPRWVQAFGKAAQRRGDVQVVVKGHPNYPLERYSDTAELCADLPVHFIRDIDLHPLLDIAAAVVTDYSHAGKEALLFGKPLVVVNLTDTPYPWNRYEQYGVATLVSRIDEIEEALDRILDDANLLRQLERARAEVIVPRYNHLNDGRAAERILELLSKT